MTISCELIRTPGYTMVRLAGQITSRRDLVALSAALADAPGSQPLHVDLTYLAPGCIGRRRLRRLLALERLKRQVLVPPPDPGRAVRVSGSPPTPWGAELGAPPGEQLRPAL